MNPQCLTFEYVSDADKLLKKLCLERDSDEADDFLELLSDIAPRVKPMAAIAEAAVSADVPEPDVRIGGELFHGELIRSRVLGAEVVWPYLATCGREGYDRMKTVTDPLERVWAEYILEDGLELARHGLDEYFQHNIYEGKTAMIAPGSLKEWPIQEQRPLFRLMAEAAEKCGVVLTESLLMLPNKSVSGFRFPSEEGYVSCTYCPREVCPRRKAPYDASATFGGH